MKQWLSDRARTFPPLFMLLMSTVISFGHGMAGDYWLSLAWLIAVFVWFVNWRLELMAIDNYNASKQAYERGREVFDEIQADYYRLRKEEIKWKQR